MALGPSVQRVSCPILLATTIALVSAGSLGAQSGNERSNVSPSAPRRFTREEASKIAGLKQQIHRLQEMGRFAEALTPARELLEIRTRLQGAGHWETAGSRHLLDVLKQLANLPQEGQRAIGLTYSEARRAINLEGKGAYAEAEKIYRAVIDEVDPIV
jgi:hypothetical protein